MAFVVLKIYGTSSVSSWENFLLTSYIVFFFHTRLGPLWILPRLKLYIMWIKMIRHFESLTLSASAGKRKVYLLYGAQ
jgi:hypothetical protein